MAKISGKGISQALSRVKDKKKVKRVKKFVQGGKTKKQLLKKSQFNRVKDPVELNRGVVYLSHIPHGFYEHEIEHYFKQFGKVTGVNLPRSKTGRSRGYAFVEFDDIEVAKVAADTMNNFLIMNRLLKAKFIAPEEQKSGLFRKLTSLSERKTNNRLKAAQETRKHRDPQDFKTKAANMVNRMKSRLRKAGVEYDLLQLENGDSGALLTSVRARDPEVGGENDTETENGTNGLESKRGRSLRKKGGAVKDALKNSVEKLASSSAKGSAKVKKVLGGKLRKGQPVKKNEAGAKGKASKALKAVKESGIKAVKTVQDAVTKKTGVKAGRVTKKKTKKVAIKQKLKKVAPALKSKIPKQVKETPPKKAKQATKVKTGRVTKKQPAKAVTRNIKALVRNRGSTRKAKETDV